MFKLSLKCALGLFIVFCSIYKVACIKCFTCQSNYDPKCADPFDNSSVPITDCNKVRGFSDSSGLGPTVCRKIRERVNGEWRYVRECAYQGEIGIQEDEKFCFKRTDTDNIYTEHCTCNSKDGCNSSTVFTSMPLFILFSLVSLSFKIL